MSRAVPARKYASGILTLALASVFGYQVWRIDRFLGRSNFGDTGTAAGIAALYKHVYGVVFAVLLVVALLYLLAANHTPVDSHWSFDLGTAGSCVVGLSVLAAAVGTPLGVVLATSVLGVVGIVLGLVGTLLLAPKEGGSRSAS